MIYHPRTAAQRRASSGVLFNGADVDAEFGIYGDGSADPDAIVENNIVKNIGEMSIWIPTTGIDVISYQFILTYNPMIIQAQNPAVTVGRTLSENGAVTINQTVPGVLNVVITRANPMVGAGTLFDLKFNAIGSPGQISPLIWQTFQFNEGNPDDNPVNGQVRLTVLSSANASIGGRVLSAFGQAIPKARVTLTDVQGRSRSVISSPMGYYIFNDVEVGQTYFVAASAKRFRFNPMVVSVSGDLTELALSQIPPMVYHLKDSFPSRSTLVTITLSIFLPAVSEMLFSEDGSTE